MNSPLARESVQLSDALCSTALRPVVLHPLCMQLVGFGKIQKLTLVLAEMYPSDFSVKIILVLSSVIFTILPSLM